MKRTSNRGFTLIEMLVVLVIASVGLGIAVFTFSGTLGRSAARGAAQIFSRDLAQARSYAARSRAGVAIVFDEDSLGYRLTVDTGAELLRRRFGEGDDLPLSAIDLELAGDSVRFDNRGLADVPGLGKAAFTAGSVVYEVRFNGTGASRIAER